METRLTCLQSGKVEVVDSHTGGEPTRVVLSGGPVLPEKNLAAALKELRENHDYFRRAVINEPRGSEVLVGALLLPPSDPDCVAAVIFFNNAGYLGMCGHGSIGVAVTLLREGRIGTGEHLLETPAGTVKLDVHDAHSVSITNVASYRSLKDVEIDVESTGKVRGDVAWGGNWFFLVREHGLTVAPQFIPELADFASRVRRALDSSNLRGDDGSQIDHIELFGPPSDKDSADSRNFVLCPGNAYDRSPCGTGTSAKLACLLEDGSIQQGGLWRQESITGSVFAAQALITKGELRPVITGTAYIVARSTLQFEDGDPFATGIQNTP